jgi:F0F1-type ATP synthase membrane subunit b/b'
MVAIALVICPDAVPASSGHEGGHAPSIADLIFPTINFLLFVYLLRRVGGGAVRDTLVRRRDEIVSALRAAAKAKEDAGSAYEEARSQLAGLPREATQLREEMREAGEVERARRLKTATEVAARISSDARQVADQEVRAARLALREETVRAAVEQTLALLRRQIKSGDQERFLGEFAAGVQAQP